LNSRFAGVNTSKSIEVKEVLGNNTEIDLYKDFVEGMPLLTLKLYLTTSSNGGTSFRRTERCYFCSLSLLYFNMVITWSV